MERLRLARRVDAVAHDGGDDGPDTISVVTS